MNLPIFEKPRKALMTWTAVLVALLALTEGLNYGLRSIAEERRASDYRTYLATATDLIDQYDFPAALAQIEDAKRKGPNAPEPYAMAGHVRYQLKQWNQAITEYQGAITRGSREEGVFLNVVWALIELKRYEEAAALGIKTINAGVSLPALPRYVAEAYFRDAKTAEAIPYYEKALKGYPNDLYLLDHLCQSYKAAGQLEKMKDIQTRITDIEASLNTQR